MRASPPRTPARFSDYWAEFRPFVPDVAAFIFATALLALAAACSFQVDYNGSRYACDPTAPSCPPDRVCSAEGLCLQAADTPDFSDGPDGSPSERADAGVPPIDAAPPADAAPNTVALNLGERPTANITGVTTDTYIDNAIPAINYGSELAVSTDADSIKYGLIRFNLTAVPAGATILAATLRLSVFDPLESGDWQFRPLLESWSESNATYEQRKSGTAWSTAGGKVGPVAAKVAPRDVGEYTITLPPVLVQAWLDDSTINFGLRSESTSPDGRGGQYRSSESDIAAERPQLELVLKLP